MASIRKYFYPSEVRDIIKADVGTLRRWSRTGLVDSTLYSKLSKKDQDALYKRGSIPEYVYDFTSLIQCKILKSLSLTANINGSTVRKVLDYLDKIGESTDIRDLCLIRLNNSLLWVKKDQFGDLMRAIIVMGKKRGQYEFIPVLMLDDSLSELRETITVSNLDQPVKEAFINHLDTLRNAA